MRLPQVVLKQVADRYLLSLVPPAEPPDGSRVPVDICAVIDISGSMGLEAKIKEGDEKEPTEGFGLNYLDVVKHACKTLITCLGPTDRFAIVAFHTTARVVSALTEMTPSGKRTSLRLLQRLEPENSTNIWDGLLKGLECLAGSPDATNLRARQVMLFTDGQPNEIPEAGHLPSLQAYRDELPNAILPGTIATFGFGYSLDSELLDRLAQAGEGSYSFIPDASFVGTVFVNALANLRSGMCRGIRVAIEGQGIQVCGGGDGGDESGGQDQDKDLLRCDWGLRVGFGCIRYGQTRSIGFTCDQLESITLEAEGGVRVTNEIDELLAHPGGEEDVQEEEEELVRHGMLLEEFRRKLVGLIQRVIALGKDDQYEEAGRVIAQLADEIATSEVAENAVAQAYVQDLTGQIAEALSRKDWFERWGLHYLPSLGRAHRLSLCNNFKDPGVQGYGGALFGTVRDEAEKTYMDLPPPQGSIQRGPTAPAYTMRRFHNVAGPCFAPSSVVTMKGGSTKAVSEIKMGDLVVTDTQTGSACGRVVCVIKTHCVTGTHDLVRLGDGLWITPWHPVCIDGEWTFPARIGRVLKNVECPAVYSFVLDAGHTMVINDIVCVSLGHNFQSSDVLRHPYFGNSGCVRKDLRRMRGWHSGLIELRSDSCLVRDEETGLVSGLRQVFA